MTTRPHIVYATFDGLLEPLGYSQVVRVVTELATRGDYRFTICSLEKQADRDDGRREQQLDAELRSQHVRWRRRSWTPGGGPLEVAQNLRAMHSMLQQVVDEDGVDLFHARSYMPASVTRQLGRRHGIPYLFDTRGFWVDERLESGRWFGGGVGRRAARMWEAKLYEDAAGVVMLTEIAVDEILANPSIPWAPDRPASVIPTCVDYDEFELGGPPDPSVISGAHRQVLESSLVVGYIGSVKSVYPLEESLRLFDHVLARRPDAHLLCLSRQHDAILEEIDRLGLPSSSYTLAQTDHRQMPQWLRLVDWGLLLRNTHQHQRGYIAAMPTKLAEFFATGVRPVFCGASNEVRRWVEHAGSGVVLEACDEQALRDAADTIADADASPQTLWEARWRTRSHFGLAGGIERYDDTYRRVLTRQRSPRLRVLFLTEGTTVPASRFRVEQLVPHLEKRGIDCTVRPAYGDGYNRWSSTPASALYKLACSLQRIPYALDADQFDVIFLQRPAMPFSALAERLANWRNPHTIFDVDDAIFIGPDGEPDGRQKEVFDQIVRHCAHVICGNDYLADHTRETTPTTVIPTVVDTEVYRPDDTRGDSETVVVGWMGTASNFDSLSMVAPVLRRIAEGDLPVRVELVSNDRFGPLDDVDGVVQHHWSADREVAHLQRFDIGIMPLVDNPVTRGKCGFKAIQYMAVASPVVASPVGVNNEILGEQRAGLLADGPRQFDQALRQLIDSAAMRERMGRMGRRIVEHNYSVQAVIDRYVRLFEAVARRAPAPVDDTAPRIDTPGTQRLAEF